MSIMTNKDVVRCQPAYAAIRLGVSLVSTRSRYSLALTGIVVVVASLGTAIGVLSVLGVDTTLIVWEVRIYTLYKCSIRKHTLTVDIPPYSRAVAEFHQWIVACERMCFNVCGRPVQI